MRRNTLALAILFLLVFIYQSVLRPLLEPVVLLPNLPGGLPLSTMVLMLFSLFHAAYTLGWRHSLVFFGLSAVISWLFEQVGVASGLVYGSYHYTDVLGIKLGHVPLLIPLAWFMMIYPSYVIANLIASGRPAGAVRGLGPIVWLSFTSAMVMTAWDLVIDPILSGPKPKAWVWENGGPYFGIPLQNYFGWMLTTFTVYLVYRSIESVVPPRPGGPVSLGTVALPLIAYGAMMFSDMIVTSLPALRIIAPFAMGLPLVAAASQLMRLAAVQDASARTGLESFTRTRVP